MAKQKANKAESLIRLFEETDQLKHSEKDLDGELKAFGIDSESLVREGLLKIEEAMRFAERHIHFRMPMAAAKKADKFDDELLFNKDKQKNEDSSGQQND
jgi:hypothetical protein